MPAVATSTPQALPLPQAAHAASMDYWALRGLVIRGVIRGELRRGRWWVDLQSLQNYTREPLQLEKADGRTAE